MTADISADEARTDLRRRIAQALGGGMTGAALAENVLDALGEHEATSVPHYECIKEALRCGTVDPRERTLELRATVERLTAENERLRGACSCGDPARLHVNHRKRIPCWTYIGSTRYDVAALTEGDEEANGGR